MFGMISDEVNTKKEQAIEKTETTIFFKFLQTPSSFIQSSSLQQQQSYQN